MEIHVNKDGNTRNARMYPITRMYICPSFMIHEQIQSVYEEWKREGRFAKGNIIQIIREITAV